MIRFITLMSLALVAGCQSSPTSSTTTTTTTTKPGFLVATYNIHGCSRPAQLAADMLRLREVDVWALQEVRIGNEGDPLETLTAILPPDDWHIAYVALNPMSSDFEGQVIVSRFPIQRTELWELPSDGSKRRAALVAWLQPTGWDDEPLIIVNTDHEPSFLSIAEGNDRQVQSLTERLKGLREDRVIVAGDFNCAGRLLRLRSHPADVTRLNDAMADAGLTPLMLDDDPESYANGWVSRRLDHVFLGNLTATMCGVEESCTGSDHRPVWCAISPVARE